MHEIEIEIEIEHRRSSQQRRAFAMLDSTVEKVQVTFECRPKGVNRSRMFKLFTTTRCVRVARRI